MLTRFYAAPSSLSVIGRQRISAKTQQKQMRRLMQPPSWWHLPPETKTEIESQLNSMISYQSGLASSSKNKVAQSFGVKQEYAAKAVAKHDETKLERASNSPSVKDLDYCCLNNMHFRFPLPKHDFTFMI